jgi:hypothetical protein
MIGKSKKPVIKKDLEVSVIGIVAVGTIGVIILTKVIAVSGNIRIIAIGSTNCGTKCGNAHCST